MEQAKAGTIADLIKVLKRFPPGFRWRGWDDEGVYILNSNGDEIAKILPGEK